MHLFYFNCLDKTIITGNRSWKGLSTDILEFPYGWVVGVLWQIRWIGRYAMLSTWWSWNSQTFKMAIQSQKNLCGWSKWPDPLSDSCLGTICTLNGGQTNLYSQIYDSKRNDCYFEPIFESSSDLQECFGRFAGASQFLSNLNVFAQTTGYLLRV